MEINFDNLKVSSIKVDTRLRLPLNTLTIKSEEKTKKFSDFVSDIIETESGHKFRTILSDVLIDTGNEAKYIIMSAYYLNTFKEKIEDTAFEKQIIEDFRGNKRLTEVSIKRFEFSLYNATFESKIGFTHQTSINALDIINIGIKSIKQFLNIFFPFDNKNYYYCQNI